MAYDYAGEGSLDYFPCRYGRSRLLFRGPRRDLGGRYAVVLGGIEAYGRYIPQPYPALLEDGLGLIHQLLTPEEPVNFENDRWTLRDARLQRL